MILDRPYVMPYAYKANVDIQRKRSVVATEFVATGHVEGIVKEVSLADAPVVLSWTVGRGSDAVNHEIRHFDGAFYIAAFRTHDVFPAKYEHGVFSKTDLPSKPGQKSFSAAKLCTLSQARFKTPMSHEETGALNRVLSEGFFIPAVDTSKVVGVHKTNEADRRAAAKALLDDALVVRRDLWIRIGEPRFIIRRAEQINGGGYSPFADIYFGPFDCNALLVPNSGKFVGSPMLTNFNSVNDLQAFDDAIAEAGLARDFRDLKVHDPSVFTTDWDLNARARLVDFAVARLAPGIGAQSIATVTAWADARDAAARFRATGDRIAIDDAVATSLPILTSTYNSAKPDVLAEIEDGMSVLTADLISHPSSARMQR
ncbi:hypothetical protein GOB57_24465 [Sinorhizobium meliloti]|nr:hypothetical protein [Sinorhizobium meliloti]